jgi:predicted enzyme related to lactoylglutathione lyase
MVLAVHPVTAFVGVTDLVRAAQFYGTTLGLQLQDESPFALVAETGGTMLRITAVAAPATPGYTVAGWRVADLDSIVDVLAARGVRFTRYEGMGQDKRGIWTAPSGARIAWFTDPDANLLSLTDSS